MILMDGKTYNVIDYDRFVLIVVVILCHIVNFGRLYPTLQNGMALVVMPAFLIITGYLVNVEKDRKTFLLYLLSIALPYTVMSLGYALLSLYLPVRDGATDCRLITLLDMLLFHPIGPYWFFHTMMICAFLYYVSFNVLCKSDKFSAFILFIAFLIIVSWYIRLIPLRFAFSFLIGVGVRQFCGDFMRFFRPSVFAAIPLVLFMFSAAPSSWHDMTIILLAVCFLCFYSGCVNGRHGRLLDFMGYVGRNTFPVYVFHPVFTMAAKYMLPLFGFDPTGLLHTFVTVVLCVAGSLSIAFVMDKTRMSYCFGRKRILR